MNVCKFARSVKLHRSNPPPESPAIPPAAIACLSRPAVRLMESGPAAGVLAALPMLVLFFATMRTFIAGLTAGAVK